MFVPDVLVDFLRLHGSRVIELHLWAGEYASLFKLPGRLNVLADRLERLALVGTQRGGTVTLRSLFLGYTPAMKALVLQRVPWVPSNAFPNFIYLDLSRLPWFLIEVFLDLLRKAPQLQLLHVDECNIDIFDFDGSKIAYVSLPRLRRLSFGHLSFDPIPHILSHLDLPANVMFRLYSLRFWQDGGDDDFEDLVLANPFTVSNDFTRLEIVVGMNWRKLVAEGDSPRSGGFWVDFVLHAVTTSEDWEGWLLNVGHMVSLSSIQTLCISVRFWDTLIDLADYLPRLKSLIVEEQTPSAEDGREYAAVACVATLLLQDDPVSLPNLESLAIDACCALPDHEVIEAAVRRRHRYKRRLRFLKIRVDPSQYTTEYISEKYTEVCKYVDEVLFVSEPVWQWKVNDGWRADHDYWVLRPSEDPMRAMEYWYDEPMHEDS